MFTCSFSMGTNTRVLDKSVEDKDKKNVFKILLKIHAKFLEKCVFLSVSCGFKNFYTIFELIHKYIF